MDHVKDTWLYSTKAETRRYSVALFDLAGNMDLERLHFFFFILCLSKNDIKSTVVIWWPQKILASRKTGK